MSLLSSSPNDITIHCRAHRTSRHNNNNNNIQNQHHHSSSDDTASLLSAPFLDGHEDTPILAGDGEPMICTLSNWFQENSKNGRHRHDSNKDKHNQHSYDDYDSNCGPELTIKPIATISSNKTTAAKKKHHRRSRSHSSAMSFSSNAISMASSSALFSNIPLTISTTLSADHHHDNDNNNHNNNNINDEEALTPLRRRTATWIVPESSSSSSLLYQQPPPPPQSTCIRVDDIVKIGLVARRTHSNTENGNSSNIPSHAILIVTRGANAAWEITCATHNGHDLLWALLQAKCQDAQLVVETTVTPNEDHINEDIENQNKQQQQREPPLELGDDHTASTTLSSSPEDQKQQQHPYEATTTTTTTSKANISTQLPFLTPEPLRRKTISNKESVCDSIDALTEECQRYALTRETLSQKWERGVSKVQKECFGKKNLFG